MQWACRRLHSLVRVNHGKPPSKQEKKKIPNLVSRSLFFSPRLQNFFLPSPPHRKKGELLPSVTLKKQPLLLLVVIGSIIIQSISFLSRGHSTPLCLALPCVTLLREALVYFYLQRSAPIQLKTSENLPNICQKFAKKACRRRRGPRRCPRGPSPPRWPGSARRLRPPPPPAVRRGPVP